MEVLKQNSFKRKLTGGFLFGNFLLFLVYFGTGWLGIQVQPVGGVATLIWAPTGVALASLFLFGYRLWPAIFLGALCVTLSTGASVAAALGVALGNVIEALAGSFLLKKAKFESQFTKLSYVLYFVVLAVILSTAMSATVGVTSLLFTQFISSAEFWKTWRAWWVGDALGNLIVAPLIFSWFHYIWRKIRPWRWFEIIFVTTSIVVAADLIFGGFFQLSGVQHFSLIFILFVFILWVALRFSLLGSSTGVFVISIFAIYATTNGFGPFAITPLIEGLYSLHGYLAILAVTGLILSAEVEEIKRRERVLKMRSKRYRMIVETTKVIAWEASLKTWQFTYVSPQAEEVLGYPVEQWYTKDFWPERIHPDDRDWAMQYCEKMSQSKTHYEFEYRMFKASGEVIWLRDFVSVVRRSNQDDSLVGFMIDVTEQVLARQKMEELTIAAQSSNRAKTYFLANVSHEIRTPLNAIVGFAEILQTSELSPEERKKYLDIILYSGRSLANIINDVLDLSKVETGKLEVDRIHFDLKGTIQEVISVLKLSADAKGLKFDLTYESEFPEPIYSDPKRLRQILINMIGNAIKFTDEGKISVRVQKKLDEKSLKIFIEDTGIGIKPDQVRLLFRPFSQTDSSNSRKHGGTGLGLELSRKLARLLGGEVSLEKSALGEGSTFLVEIPISSPEDKSSEISPQDQPPLLSNLSGMKVLIVDDAFENQTLVEKILSLHGVQVEVASSGEECLKKVRTRSYDLILMDVQMPGQNGLETTQILRKQNYLSPIVALTAHALNEDRQACLQAGCDDYLSKPIDRTQLLERVAYFRNFLREE